MATQRTSATTASPSKRNPFTPNFGQIPTHMAGREQIIDSLRTAFEEGPGNPDLCTVFTGARGTGKTALLQQLSREAERYGWITAGTTAIPGMLQDLYEQSARKASELVAFDNEIRMTGLSVGQLVGIQWESAQQPEPNWRSRMTDILEALDQTGTGILLFLDEIDPDLDEAVQLVTFYQHFVGEGRNVALLMAGLPHSTSSLLRGKSTSFLRRANQVALGRIPRAEIADAFRETVSAGGKKITDPALDAAADAIEGFPFMMQLVGYRAWSAAGKEAVIDESAVARGIEIARSDMEHRVLKATLDDLSRRDLDVLEAMLPDESLSASAEVAERIGMSAGNMATYRKRLLEQGAIEDAGRGHIRFALPFLRDYLPHYLESQKI